MPKICVVCGSDYGIQHFAIAVDGIALEVQPDLCAKHSDAYLYMLGEALGRLLRDPDRLPALLLPKVPELCAICDSRREAEIHSEAPRGHYWNHPFAPKGPAKL